MKNLRSLPFQSFGGALHTRAACRILHVVATISYSASGHRIGERHHRARWSDAEVRAVRAMVEIDGIPAREVSRRLAIPWATVWAIAQYLRRATIPVRIVRERSDGESRIR